MKKTILMTAIMSITTLPESEDFTAKIGDLDSTTITMWTDTFTIHFMIMARLFM